jgi:hypothetical protein
MAAMLKPAMFSQLLVLLTLLAPAAAGQAPLSLWDDIRMLATGTAVRVYGTFGFVTRAFQSATDDAFCDIAFSIGLGALAGTGAGLALRWRRIYRYVR